MRVQKEVNCQRENLINKPGTQYSYRCSAKMVRKLKQYAFPPENKLPCARAVVAKTKVITSKPSKMQFPPHKMELFL